MDELGLNIAGLLTHFISFGVLLGLLILLFYRPLRRVLDERRSRIEEGLRASEAAQEAAEEASAEARSEVQQGREEAQRLVAQAQEIAQRIEAEARSGAEQRADQYAERVRAEIEQERDQAVQQLRDEFADLTIAAAERVIGQSLSRDDHQRIISEVLAESAVGASDRSQQN